MISHSHEVQTRLLILGGGQVGLNAYRAVMRQMGAQVRRGKVEVTVVDTTPYHTFHGFTGEMLGGVLPPQDTRIPLTELLPHAHVIEATVTRAELPMQRVHIQYRSGSTDTLPYDHLLIATGSRDPSESLPGLREHGWLLKDSRDIQAFRAHLGRRIADGQPTTLAVIGGDCAGIEMAGVEMAAALRECLTRAGLPGEVHLVCSRGVMDCVQKKHAGLAAHARQSLERAGVKLHLGQRATGITAVGICLADGSVLRADEVLYAAKIALGVLPGTEGLPRDTTGRLLTDEFLRVQGEVRLWAGGDTARVKHPTAAGDYPTNGLWDMKQGLWAGRNMARSVRGQSLQHFSYRGLGQAAGLGQGDAVAELFGMPLSGVLAWWLRGLFSVWHMPSKARQARTFFERLRPSGMSVAPTPSPQPARDSELKVKEAQ